MNATAEQSASVNVSALTLSRRAPTHNPAAIAITNTPTVRTSQISTFGPVTAMKLSMSTSDQTPVIK